MYFRPVFLNRQVVVVVVVTGAWAPYIGRMAGVKVPLVAMKHAYVVTDKIEGIQKMPNVRDHDSSVYLKLQGDALSVGGYENNPIFCDEVLFLNYHRRHLSELPSCSVPIAERNLIKRILNLPGINR